MSRPTVITARVVSLLVTGFHNGLSVRQACFQAGISHEAYYARLRSDKAFTDTMSRAQQLVSMTARTSITNAIKSGDVAASKWWLERRDRDDFSLKQEIEMEGTIETPAQPPLTEEKINEIMRDQAKLVAYRYRSKESDRINRTAESESDRVSQLTKLYALPREEMVRRALANVDQEIQESARV